MKKIVLLICFFMVLTLTGCSKSEGIYKAGKYTAEGIGMGKIVVEVEVSGDKIKSVSADVSNETESIGGAAKDEIISQIIEAQSTDIDGVAGATITSKGICMAVDKALNEAKGIESAEKSAVLDGTYSGKAPSFGVMNEMELAVTFKDNAIVSIETVCAGSASQYNEDEYSSIYKTVEDNLFPRIIELQSLSVDAICGVTVSSNAANK